MLQIALNNPGNGNALDIKLCNELLEAFDRAEGDCTVGAIKLTANGPDFCAGIDLGEALDADKVELGGGRPSAPLQYDSAHPQADCRRRPRFGF